MKKIIIANLKMNLGLKNSLKLFLDYQKYFSNFNNQNKEIIVCPSEFLLPFLLEKIKKTKIKLGAQNIFWQNYGAYTGEFSLESLIELGGEFTIIGHSERRQYLLESDEMINKKVLSCLKTKKITPVLCIGENLEQKNRGEREEFLKKQLKADLKNVVLNNQKLIIAYEPIWAIGTGEFIDPVEAQAVHDFIKKTAKKLLKIENNNISVIYGGSVNEKNAKKFLEQKNIDGLLVGGASLKAKEFFNICSIKI